MPVAEKLVEESQWEEALQSTELAVLTYGHEGKEFLRLLQYRDDPWAPGEAWLPYPVFIAGRNMVHGGVFKLTKGDDPSTYAEFSLTGPGKKAVKEFHPGIQLVHDTFTVPKAAIDGLPDHFTL